MTNPYRAMCAELVDSLENARRIIQGADGTLHINTAEFVLRRARALLAQHEPEGLTDEELETFLVDVACQNGDMYYVDPKVLARAIFARWGRPTPQPVAVSERLPKPGEWVWHCYAGVRFWQHGRYNGRQFFIGDGPESQPATHWLPANALPTPEDTNE